MMLTVDGIAFSYGTRPVLESVSIDVKRGEICSILGNNGAGKTTLLKCILGILRPRSGVVLLAGEDTSRLARMEVARRMGYVAQRDGGGRRLTVFDAVLMGRRPHIGWGTGAGDLKVVEEVLGALNLEDLALRYLDELSGGEQQKVMLARALAQEPGILLLDEPTSNLDLRNQFEVMETLGRVVAERGIAALMAIHDVNLALRFSHKFILLRGGSVFACGGPEIIDEESMEKVYGVKVEVETRGDTRMVVPVSACRHAGGDVGGRGAGDGKR
ncbi:MAG: ABC transporter ATP-binding protein [Actinobacteria bacterium]|nr:ABC transporter ATP-binding protein [Actinomycetota bacterium]